MKEHLIQTSKTGRYYTLGELNNSTKEIVFAFHGYAQLAKDFIKNFEPISSENRFIIAPEGLSKFYFKGFNGVIGASWMTKEDRENEIKDYLNFCENIYNQFADKINEHVSITILGFSQGGATASRWFTESKIKNTRLILWGSSIPHDINYEKLNTKVKEKIKIVIGDKDEFINEDTVKKDTARLRDKNVNFELIKYPGKHNIQPGLLKELQLFD